MWIIKNRLDVDADYNHYEYHTLGLPVLMFIQLVASYELYGLMGA